MPTPKDDARVAILKQWMAENDRNAAWMGRRTGYTRGYIASVIKGRFAFTDTLAWACIEQFNINFGSVGPEEDSNLEPEAAALAIA